MIAIIIVSSRVSIRITFIIRHTSAIFFISISSIIINVVTGKRLIIKVFNYILIVTTQQTFVGLEDVFKTCSRHVLKTSSTCLQHNNFTSSKMS